MLITSRLARHATFATLLAAVFATAFALAPRTASACGGCFSPPATVQTVTYHRMALAASSTHTTLWDQFGYSGRPEEFSWILPIQGGPDVQVELADVRFLAALDDLSEVNTGPTPIQPHRLCPQCYTPHGDSYYCSERSPSATYDAGAWRDSAAFADASGGSDAGVTVLREQVVGPYAVAVLRGTDAGALRTWLTTNGYVVSASLEPVIDHYIAMRSDFVALRLRDGAGLGRMQPVRVTAPGYQPLLPLRMVAAGVADRVEMVLMTLSDSRLETTNFPSAEIGDNFVFDFGRDGDSRAAFRRVEREMRAANGGRLWLTESAQANSQDSYRATAERAAIRWRAESETASVTEDMRVALQGMGSSPVLTRLHADLTVDALDRDLTLAAARAGERSRNYQVRRVMNARAPDACPPLACASGIVSGGEGEIVDPFGAVLAPDVVIPAIYTAGTLALHVSRFNHRPRYADGRPYTPPTPRAIDTCSPGIRCTASPGRTPRAAGWILAIGAAATVLIVRARRRRHDRR